MSLTVDEFCEMYPTIWHMAEDGSWPSIQRHGLRSTSSLLDLYRIAGDERDQVEAQHRSSSVTLRSDGGLPSAVVRDQAPMSDEKLARVLDDGLVPSDWYRMLNSRVFFWVREARLEKLLNARLYRSRAHTVLTVDSRKLLARYQDAVVLAPINTGATLFNPERRGLSTFLPLSEYPFQERKKAGKEPVVELAVLGMVEDIENMVIRVERRQGAEEAVLLWPTEATLSE